MFRQKVLSDYRFSNGGPWQRRIQKPVKHLTSYGAFCKKSQRHSVGSEYTSA